MKRNIILVITAVALVAALQAHPAEAFCFEEAGAMYGVSPVLLWAIAKVESNFDPTAINHNKNGSYDYGVMQINSSWYKTLGAERWDKLSDACMNVKIGAWVLSHCMKEKGYSWDGVGCYNARSPEKSRAYAEKVQKIVKKIYAAQKEAEKDKKRGNL